MTGTQGFSRIKVGVGEKPQGWDLADHVLGHFSCEDRQRWRKLSVMRWMQQFL